MSLRLVTCLMLCNLACSAFVADTFPGTKLTSLTLDGDWKKKDYVLNIESYDKQIVGKWIDTDKEDNEEVKTVSAKALFTLELYPPTGVIWTVRSADNFPGKGFFAVGKSMQCTTKFPITVNLYMGSPSNQDAVKDLDFEASYLKIAEMMQIDEENGVDWKTQFDEDYQFNKLQMSPGDFITVSDNSYTVFGNSRILTPLEAEDEEIFKLVENTKTAAELEKIVKLDGELMGSARILAAFKNLVYKYIDYETRALLDAHTTDFDNASELVISFLKDDSSGFYGKYTESAVKFQNEGTKQMQLDTMNLMFTSIATALRAGTARSNDTDYFAASAFEQLMIANAIIRGNRSVINGYDEIRAQMKTIFMELYENLANSVTQLTDDAKDNICDGLAEYFAEFLLQKLLLLLGDANAKFKKDVTTYLSLTAEFEEKHIKEKLQNNQEELDKFVSITDGKNGINIVKMNELLEMMGMSNIDTKVGTVDLNDMISYSRRRLLVL